MRFVIIAEVRGESSTQWLHRVVHIPVGFEWDCVLKYPGVTLTPLVKDRAPGGGMRVICAPLEGDHFFWRLKEHLFEPFGVPDA